MLVKNVVKSIEFGDYDNYSNLIPNEIIDTRTIPNTNKIMVYVGCSCANNNDIIALWGEYDIDSIDWASFGLEKPEPIKVLYTYEVLDYDNKVIFVGQAYGINDFHKKYKIDFHSYSRIRCVN